MPVLHFPALETQIVFVTFCKKLLKTAEIFFSGPGFIIIAPDFHSKISTKNAASAAPVTSAVAGAFYLHFQVIIYCKSSIESILSCIYLIQLPDKLLYKDVNSK